MGFLNNTTVTVDAILTKKGRELLAQGTNAFNITKFALSDDEVDYRLFDTSHPNGTDFYGAVIENMPLLEAFPDETQVMKYKLATLPRGTSKLPILDVGFNSITLKQGASLAVTPQTLNYLGATSIFEAGGYTATIADSRVLNSFTGVGVNTEEAERLNTTTTVGTNVSKTVIGTSINLTATSVNTLFGSRSKLQTTVTVVGRDSGARLTIPVTISKTN